MKNAFRSLCGSVLVLAVFAFAPVAYADIDPTIPTANTVSATTSSATPVTLSLSGVSNDANAGGALVYATSSDPSHGTLGSLAADGSVTYTPGAGYSGSDSFSYTVTEGATSSAPATATITVNAVPTPDTAQIEIRDGSTLIGPVTVTLPDAGAAPVDIIPSAGGGAHAVPARSVLAVVEALDAATSTFDISDLQFFSSFSSFLINCISIPAATSTPLCSQWQYVVNGFAPAVGMDQTTLNNGDTAILYFGFPRQVSLSAPSVVAGQSFTATAQTYNPTDNTFAPATAVTIGVTQPDPANPFTPLEIATSSVDANGQAIFTLNATGTYQVGLQEDFYFPTTDLTVTDALATTTTPTSPAPSGGGGGGGGVSHSTFNIPAALAYLSGKQRTDGSFSNSSSITDWTAMAFAAADSGSAKTNLRNYLLTATPPMGAITDYERHAMALEALGIDPYTGTSVNYIAPILATFDGTQIGDASLDNDDIFGIIALTHAGYTGSDTTIQKVAAFIISKQKADGSWDESPDLTAAALQALGRISGLTGWDNALTHATAYLRANESPDGGWDNVDSTSWVQTGINSLIEAQTIGFLTESAWTSGAGYYPTDALANAQQSDGAMRLASDPIDTRIWSTSYAVVAASGKSWVSILQSFSQPSEPSAEGGLAGPAATSTPAAATSTVPTTATSTSATTTLAVATSTPPAATTTPAVTNQAVNTANTSPSPVQPKKKIAAVPAKPIPTPAAPILATSNQTQIAAAASGLPGQGNVFASVWRAIVSFFSALF